MEKDDYINNLENVIKQMLRPIKDIPFKLVIEAMSGKKILPFNIKISHNKKLLNILINAATEAGKEINKNGIFRPRANEVGYAIEPFIKQALSGLGLSADTPTTNSGKKKSTGYPDILFWYNKNPYYLECKTYNKENIDTTFRSFYFSPSDDFKITHNAPHLLLSYEIFVAGEQGNDHIYKCAGFKIISLENLSVDVKYEFNADNKRLYSTEETVLILAERKIQEGLK